MSAIATSRYRWQSAAKRFSEQRVTALSASDSDMEDSPRYSNNDRYMPQTGGSIMSLRRWEQTEKPAKQPALVHLPSAIEGVGTPGMPEATTEAATSIGSLFILRRIGGRSLNFLIDMGCTHKLLSQTVYDILPT